MSIPINIEDLLNKHIVESTRIEFKSDFNPNPVIHYDGSGYIILKPK